MAQILFRCPYSERPALAGWRCLAVGETVTLWGRHLSGLHQTAFRKQINRRNVGREQVEGLMGQWGCPAFLGPGQI